MVAKLLKITWNMVCSMNPNAGKYTREQVEKMTIFERYELFGCLEAEDVMPSLLKKVDELLLVETEEFIQYG